MNSGQWDNYNCRQRNGTSYGVMVNVANFIPWIVNITKN